MPPSLRHRAAPQPTHFPEPLSDSDDAFEEGVIGEDEEFLEAHAVGLDPDDEEEEDDEDQLDYAGSPAQSHADFSAPVPPNYREISTLASWTVSSSKPGCSIPQLRSPSTSLFWQSDGPQPHYLNIHFFKLVRIVGLRLFLDFDADESYTPTRIIFLAGSGMNDLVEWGEMKLEQPKGWIWVDFEGVGEGSSDEDEDEDMGDNDDTQHPPPINTPNPAGPTRTPLTAGTPLTLDPNTSDHENTQPTHPLPTDPQPLETPFLPQPTPNPNLNLTPSLGPNTSFSLPTPSIPRPHPRHALSPLPQTPNPQPADRKDKPRKIPVLRAHLVQIKILENHQNGKDTHLRGLQIFSRENREGYVGEGERERQRRGREREDAEDVEGGAEAKKGKGKVKSAKKSGGAELTLRGLSLAEWDVEPSIR